MFSVGWTRVESADGGERDRVVVGGVKESGGDKGGSTKKEGLIPGGAGFVNSIGDDLKDVAGIVIGLSAAALALALLALHRKGALERPAWMRRSGRSS